MTVRDELEGILRSSGSKGNVHNLTYRTFFRDHGPALLEALRDSERMDALEQSQRADVYWHENGEQELAGYEWGCGGQYATARDALDAAIDTARRGGG